MTDETSWVAGPQTEARPGTEPAANQAAPGPAASLDGAQPAQGRVDGCVISSAARQGGSAVTGTPATQDQDADEERQRWEDEERKVGQTLSQDGSVLTGLAQHLARTSVLVLAGIGLRTFLVPAPATALAVAVVLAAWAAAGPAMGQLAIRLRAIAGQPEQEEPLWVRELTDYRRGLDRRLSVATLEIADRYMAALTAGRWRSAHLYVARRTGTQWLTMAMTAPLGDRVIIYLGDHVVAAGPQVVAATLAHEVRHLSRWRLSARQVSRMAEKSCGWLLLGWAVPRAALLPAIVAFHLAVIAVDWAIEISCDLGAAAAEGKPAVMAVFTVMTASARNRYPTRWQRAIVRTLTLATGSSHPPTTMRRALARALARNHATVPQAASSPGAGGPV